MKNIVMKMKDHLDAEMPRFDPLGLLDNHRPVRTEACLKRLMELSEIARRLRAARRLFRAAASAAAAGARAELPRRNLPH